jgi:hypothetical protein
MTTLETRAEDDEGVTERLEGIEGRTFPINWITIDRVAYVEDEPDSNLQFGRFATTEAEEGNTETKEVSLIEWSRKQNFSIFSKLHQKWKEETRFSSSLSQICENEHYRTIIDYGEDALFYIFRDLRENRENPDYWFVALEEITGENPVPESHFGRPDQMAEDWIEWAIDNDYLSDG